MSKIPGTQANKEAKMEQGTGGMGQQSYGQGNRTCVVAVSCYQCSYLYTQHVPVEHYTIPRSFHHGQLVCVLHFVYFESELWPKCPYVFCIGNFISKAGSLHNKGTLLHSRCQFGAASHFASIQILAVGTGIGGMHGGQHGHHGTGSGVPVAGSTGMGAGTGGQYGAQGTDHFGNPQAPTSGGAVYNADGQAVGTGSGAGIGSTTGVGHHSHGTGMGSGTGQHGSRTGTDTSNDSSGGLACFLAGCLCCRCSR